MRKTRSDCRVGTFEKKNGLSPGTVKKPKTPSPSIKPEMINSLIEESGHRQMVILASQSLDVRN